MTEQQAIDFIRNYEPVESPYENISDMAYNARRCATMAKKEYKLSEADAVAIRTAYIFYGIEKR